jgi:serine/threonine protein kinase
MVETEIKIMKEMNSPYICKLHDNFESSKEIYLIEEYISGMPLSEYIRLNGVTEIKARFFLKQLAEAINYLHTNDKHKGVVIHRDLKLENIIID